MVEERERERIETNLRRAGVRAAPSSPFRDRACPNSRDWIGLLPPQNRVQDLNQFIFFPALMVLLPPPDHPSDDLDPLRLRMLIEPSHVLRFRPAMHLMRERQRGPTEDMVKEDKSRYVGRM